MSGGLDTDLTRPDVRWAPGPCSADSLGFGIDELGKDVHMSGYVGMDVYASQVAIVDDAGGQPRNRSLANDPAKLMPILGGCRRVRRWCSRRPTAGVGC